MTLGAVLLMGSAAAAEDRPGPTVVVQFQVGEQSTERVAQAVLAPAEQALMTLGGVTEINGSAMQGFARVEIRFEGGATEKDVATVSRRVDELVLVDDILVRSRTVRLAPPPASP
jgi:multidrug efflux pump subunit AcrB